MGNNASKELWAGKVAFGSRIVAAGSGKVSRSIFSSFDGYTLPVPIFAGTKLMTMHGPNALHWPQSKI